MIEKTLASVIPPVEFQITTPKESTNQEKRLQVQGILLYRHIPKYLPIVKPTELYQSQPESPIRLDPVEDFSIAQISQSVTNSTSTFLIFETL